MISKQLATLFSVYSSFTFIFFSFHSTINRAKQFLFYHSNQISSWWRKTFSFFLFIRKCLYFHCSLLAYPSIAVLLISCIFSSAVCSSVCPFFPLFPLYLDECSTQLVFFLWLAQTPFSTWPVSVRITSLACLYSFPSKSCQCKHLFTYSKNEFLCKYLSNLFPF